MKEFLSVWFLGTFLVLAVVCVIMVAGASAISFVLWDMSVLRYFASHVEWSTVRCLLVVSAFTSLVLTTSMFSE